MIAYVRCYLVGIYLHEFNTLIYKLCIQYGMTDTLLIVAGDCGFGFEKPGYYENVFRHNSARLTKANNWIAMVRGNHDDPAYFNEERISHLRFRTIPDYSIVQACCGHNILCIGGAVSIDRSFRKEHDSRNQSSGTASYWSDEMPIFDDPKLTEIDRQFKIDSVITHTAPSFCELLSKAGLSEWAERDAELLTDCEKERETMDRLFEHLKTVEHPPPVTLVLRALPPELEFRNRRGPVLDARHHGVQGISLRPWMLRHSTKFMMIWAAHITI